jgi:hypothetical protein
VTWYRVFSRHQPLNRTRGNSDSTYVDASLAREHRSRAGPARRIRFQRDILPARITTREQAGSSARPSQLVTLPTAVFSARAVASPTPVKGKRRPKAPCEIAPGGSRAGRAGGVASVR